MNLAKLLVLVILLMSACIGEEKEEKNVVVVTIYPLYEITKEIAGDRLEVVSVMPPNADMHTFEPDPKTLAYIEKAKAVVFTGTLSETWEKRIYKRAKNLNKKIINASEGVKIIEGDPHFWISIKNAIIIVENIKNRLKEIDPENAEYYEKNAENFIKKLKELDIEYKNALNTCSKKIIIVTHPAYTYLAEEYGFEQIPIYEVHEVEPSPKRIKEIIEKAKKEKIKFILYEKGFDKKIAETLAREINAELLEVNPIISGNYIETMKRNLEAFKVAMECSQ